LEDTEVDPSLDYTELAKITEGFSGSDLKELCRNAVMLSVREAIKERIVGNSAGVQEIKGEEVGIQYDIYDHSGKYMRTINFLLL
jgi:SpoVK/Ycf46/Vps4 family AAA+-type ATPase